MFFRAQLDFPPPTYRNYLRYRFENSEAEYVPGGRMVVEIGACEQNPLNLVAEGARAARLIHASARAPLWLCMSGGVDSEAMAQCFLQAKVPFRAAILRFPNQLNDFDISTAIEFCERMKVTYEFFDFDFEEFYGRGRHMEYCRRYRCRSPQLAVHLELMKRISGVPVLAWNIPAIVPEKGPEDRSRLNLLLPNDHFFCYHRFVQVEQREAVPFFFAYTPELIYAAIRLPAFQEILFNESSPARAGGLTYPMKVEALRQGGIDVQRRKDKFTGFERIKTFYEAKSGLGPGAYDLLFRRPMEEEFKLPSAHVYKLSRRGMRPK